MISNDYEQNSIPSRKEAVQIANAYLQTRIYNASHPRIIFEHGVHIFNVAKIAESIAKETKQLNPDIAYVLGLLHDAGRIKDETVTGVPHSLEGYDYLQEIGCSGVAPICVTHNFIDKKVNSDDYPNIKPNHLKRIRELLADIHYNDYDRLIQLADMFSRGKEILSVQQRLNKNKTFYKIPHLSYEDKALGLQDHFNDTYGINVEEIIANTFNMRHCCTNNMTTFIPLSSNENSQLFTYPKTVASR